MDNLAFSTPILKTLKSIRIGKEGLEGKEVGIDRQIKLVPTDNPTNVEAFHHYKKIYNSAEEMVKVSFNHHLKMEMNYGVVNFLYNEAWE